MTSLANDRCEHCHNEYSLIKRKKSCAVCLQSYCNTCVPREQLNNHSFRICLICQMISNELTSDKQLLDVKVKHLRLYLQAKDILHNTCTEKRELIDLIKQNRQKPFTRLFNQQSSASQTSQQNKSRPFSTLQNTVSSFANQVNSFASNIQGYVTNTVSDVMQTMSNESMNEPQASLAAAAAAAPSPPSSHPPPPPPPPATTTQRVHRKSLSEIHNEENIEDLNIRELKEILSANFVDFKGCVEKSELMEKVRRLYRDRQTANIRARELDDSLFTDTELCKVCMDAMADCVFLDCGHMVTCVKCGKLLAECPICRSNIVRVVRVFKS